MERIEIYKKRGNVYLSKYQSESSRRSEYIVTNRKVYDELSSIRKYNIRKIVTRGDNTYIHYDDFVICISNNVLTDAYVSTLSHQINRYNNRKGAQKVKGKKVTRQNRHIGRKVVALGLAAITVYGIAKISKSKKDANAYETQIIDLDDEYDDNFLLDKNTLENDDVFEVKDGVNDNEGVKVINLSFDTEKSDEIFISNDDNIVKIDYSDFVADRQKADYVDQNYAHIITEIAEKYDVDPELMIAIAKQESGYHNPDRGGSAIGLMQIERGVWLDYVDNEYNLKFSLDYLKNLEGNITAACYIMKKECQGRMKNNPLLSLQAYNMGYGNMMKILKAYYAACGKSTNISDSEIIKGIDPTDTGWMNYRYVVGNQGDKHYVERICSYMQDRLGDEFSLKCGDQEVRVASSQKVK